MFFVLWSTGRCVHRGTVPEAPRRDQEGPSTLRGGYLHLSDRRLTRWSYAVVALLGVQILMGTMAYIYRPDPFLANTHLVTGLGLVFAVLILARVAPGS